MNEPAFRVACLFCKLTTEGSRSREHVVPQSLGNTTMVLRPGVVCDDCNNYFARKVEAPLLNHAFFIRLRFHERLVSKKGRIPPLGGSFLGDVPALVVPHARGPLVATLSVPEDRVGDLVAARRGVVSLPAPGAAPDGALLSRFLAKVALGSLADRVQHDPTALGSAVSDAQLDPVRRHARFGEPPRWPCNFRSIYASDKGWADGDGESVQRVWESDFLMTDDSELYFALALFGYEFVINVGGPDITGYQAWLQRHDGASPLYPGVPSQALRSQGIGRKSAPGDRQSN